MELRLILNILSILHARTIHSPTQRDNCIAYLFNHREKVCWRNEVHVPFSVSGIPNLFMSGPNDWYRQPQTEVNQMWNRFFVKTGSRWAVNRLPKNLCSSYQI